MHLRLALRRSTRPPGRLVNGRGLPRLGGCRCCAFAGGAAGGTLSIMLEPEPERVTGGAGDFRTTHWSVVLTAGHGDSPAAREALERLCRAYWYPLAAYARRRGCSPEDAEDLTQGLFESLLRREDLARVTPKKGRFRTFLLAALGHYLANEWRRGQRQKRGSGQVVVSFDALSAEERYRLEPALGGRTAGARAGNSRSGWASAWGRWMWRCTGSSGVTGRSSANSSPTPCRARRTWMRRFVT